VANDYRAELERNAGLKPSPLIDNSSSVKFVVAANLMFERATKRVSIFSDCLSRYSTELRGEEDDNCVRKVWAGVGEAARQFLRRENSELDIIIRGLLDTPSEPELHELLNDAITDPARRGTLTLRIARDKSLHWQDLFQRNFVVVDGRHFRFEVGDGAENTHALLQFGNPEVGAKFVRMFDKMARAIDSNADPDGNRKELLSLIYPAGALIPSEGRCRFGRPPPYNWNRFVEERSLPPVLSGIENEIVECAD